MGAGHEDRAPRRPCQSGLIRRGRHYRFSRDGLNLPLAVELSWSKNSIWLTANLGENRADLKHEELLRKNFLIQRCQFFITERTLLMAGVEDRQPCSDLIADAAEYWSIVQRDRV